jgi:hypothetical protein
MASPCRALDAEQPMIRPLRRAHRRLVLLLALILPVVIALALLRRAEPAVQRDWPFALSSGR